MWSREDEKRAMKSLRIYYEQERTETLLNTLLNKGVDITYENIEIEFSDINDREKARIMNLFKNGVSL